MAELNTLSAKKWVANYSGVAPTIDVDSGVRVGDLAIDTSTTPNTIWVNEVNTSGSPTWNLQGKVVNPTSSTTSAIALYTDTTGRKIKDSVVIVDSSGNITGVSSLLSTGKVIGRANVTSVSTTYTASVYDNVILCNAFSAAFTVTLPASTLNSGVEFNIKKIDDSANIVTVAANGTEKIDGLSSQNVASYESMFVICDGSGWYII